VAPTFGSNSIFQNRCEYVMDAPFARVWSGGVDATIQPELRASRRNKEFEENNENALRIRLAIQSGSY